MKKIFLFSLLTLSVLTSVIAQDLTPENDPIFGKSAAEPTSNPFTQSRTRPVTKNPGATDNGTGIVSNPIDGGLAILLASGALYGARRYKAARVKTA